ncbi:ABC transporter ATP-binding protein [Bailinhaonella thermotolerans]|uniref:ABC transporter ATP-binding protein n=1 Tax=Bailinhaonella thermotolerans TaxID=1070861 RepID=UPI00192A4161|nr:ABC transporter ATP-binding protein [Bailinhaonella thermotolerans]
MTLRGLTKRYGDDHAVRDLDLEVSEGEFVCLLGPSGCGKTTTLRMVAGFVEPDAGSVVIDGRDLSSVPPHRRPTSIVFQDYALFPHMTVLKNIGYGLRTQRVPDTEARRRVGAMLELLGLENLGDRYPNQLSGGQQQRVALARSLVTEPKVLLMDEPLSNLDAKMRIRLRTELRQLQKRLGLTTVYVTHDQEEALSMADRIAVMDRGELQQYATPHELYHHPANRFVADFIGLNNLLPARCDLVRGGEVLLRLDDGQAVTAAEDARGHVPAPGDRVLLSMRPEDLTPAPRDEPAGAAGSAGSANRISGKVVGHQFLGALSRYLVRVADQDVLVDEYDTTGPGTAGEITLTVPASRIRIFPDS